MIKRFFGVLLTVFLMVGLLTTVALADDSSPYGLWVGGVPVTEDNMANILVDGATGTATYTPANEDTPATLTLKDFKYEGVGHVWDNYGRYDSAAIYYNSTDPLKLVLEGTNIVTNSTNSTNNYSSSYGLYASGSIEVSGTCSLVVTGGESNYSYGVCVVFNNITMKSGSLKATGGKATNESYGVYAMRSRDGRGGDITVSGGELSGIGGEARMSYGVYAGNTITLSNGTLECRGGEAKVSHGNSVGMCSDNITVYGGELSGIGAVAGYSSTGVLSGPITVSGGKLSGIGAGAQYSFGVDASRIAVSGTGSLTGESGTATASSDSDDNYGAYSLGVDVDGSIAVSGNGKLTGTGNSATATATDTDSYAYSFGVCAGSSSYTADNGDISVSGAGSLIGQGGTATGTFSYSYGVRTSKYAQTVTANISVSEYGSLTGIADTDTNTSYGVSSEGELTVTGSEIIAQGQNAFNKKPEIDGSFIIYHGDGTDNVSTKTTEEYYKSKYVRIVKTYDVAVDVNNEYGYVSVDKNKAAAGDTITLDVNAKEGYVIDTVTVTDQNNESVVVTLKDGRYSYLQPEGSVKVTVTFKKALCSGTDADNCPSLHFKDLVVTQWYHQNVDYVLNNKLMNGVGGDKFDPDGELSRAMLVTILYRLTAVDTVTESNIEFDDVPEGEWYTDAVKWASANGIVYGFGDGTFRPNAASTREQIATILYRYEIYKKNGEIPQTDASMDYVDKDKVSDWASEAMVWCSANGIVNGKPGKILDPKGTGTRAEAAAMINRYCENVA